ncbi:hypothetical protein Pelo_11643 [Pelomyxa schiedti]|nr:hypothetical protein Pelo_11643 [Pelomyxa schiedti]
MIEEFGVFIDSTNPAVATSSLKHAQSEGQVSACNAKITLSSVKIYKYGSYWMRLSIRGDYREQLGLGEQDMVVAGLAAQCRRAGKLQEPVMCPSCCPSSSVITVTEPYGETCAKTSPEGMEQYQFTLRSNCTSSRDHLKALLLMEVKLGQISILSPTFVLRARKKPSRTTQKRNTPTPPPPDVEAHRTPINDSTTIFSSPSFSTFPSVDSVLHQHLQSVQTQQPSHQLPESPVAFCEKRVACPTSVPAVNATPPIGSYITRALRVAFNEADWRRLFSHFVVLSQHICGIADLGTAFIPRYTYPDSPGVAVITIATQPQPGNAQITQSSIEQCFTLFSLYLANLIQSYTNLYNTDLLSTGVVSVIPF